MSSRRASRSHRRLEASLWNSAAIASHPVGAKRRRMTGSAKQSRTAYDALDCFFANAPRNDGDSTSQTIYSKVIHPSPTGRMRSSDLLKL
jgi:hypothetical protein